MGGPAHPGAGSRGRRQCLGPQPVLPPAAADDCGAGVGRRPRLRLLCSARRGTGRLPRPDPESVLRRSAAVRCRRCCMQGARACFEALLLACISEGWRCARLPPPGCIRTRTLVTRGSGSSAWERPTRRAPFPVAVFDVSHLCQELLPDACDPGCMLLMCAGLVPCPPACPRCRCWARLSCGGGTTRGGVGPWTAPTSWMAPLSSQPSLAATGLSTW